MQSRGGFALGVVFIAAIVAGCNTRASLRYGGPGQGGQSGAIDSGSIYLPVANCGSTDHAARGLLPDILLVLDASGSLNDDITNLSCAAGCGASSKWAVLTSTVNKVVQQTQGQVNWGLKVFATDNVCGVDPSVEIPIGPSNASPIAAAITTRTSANGGVANGSRTPIRAALAEGTAYLSTVDDTNRKFVLLATDGLANCPAMGSSSNDDTAGAVAAAAEALAAGVPVFVVGVATEGTVTNGVDVSWSLSQIASAGGRPRAGTPKYYPAASADELARTLNMLVVAASACVLPIGTPPPSAAGAPTITTVTTTGVRAELPHDPSHTNGYDFTDASLGTIEIFGPVCERIRSGLIETLNVTYACESD